MQPAWRALAVALAVACGALLGLIGGFLVPLRILGGVEGLAAVIGLVGNLGAGLLFRRAAGGAAGAAGVLAGWAVAVAPMLVQRSEGDLIIPGSIPVDPGVGRVGLAFLALGLVGALVPLWRRAGHHDRDGRTAASPPPS